MSLQIESETEDVIDDYDDWLSLYEWLMKVKFQVLDNVFPCELTELGGDESW